MSAKIEAAQKTTRVIHELITAAHDKLLDGRPVNALGIIHKPESQAYDLHAAIGLLQRAVDLIDTTKWPTEQDYNSA